jgi:lipopolysaccharide/colanic/teichoic acid biosynthesis glycosyltransferase
MYRRWGKRALDLSIALPALIALTPVLLVLLLALRLRFGGPPLFVQRRPGWHGRPFDIYKLRTMTDDRGADGKLLPDAGRLTSFGRWLRRTSLDELPELWNVLKGDMSLVGPRPLLLQYLPLYSAEQARRHDERPGITGWAQVNGRNTLSWDEKFRLDAWYVDNVSLALDLRILFRTMALVIARKGISADSHASMPEFTGNRKSRS